jgi:hypothetical protein
MERRIARLDRKYNSQVIIKNPDKSLNQGIPNDYSSEISSEPESNHELADYFDDGTVNEVVNVYLRHRASFLALISVELFIEILFTALEVIFYKSAIEDVRST